MSLSPKIAAVLDGPDAGTLPCEVSLEDGAHRLVLHLTASGPVGLAFGALSSFLAIWTLMRVLERFSSWPFVIYRAVLGIALIAGSFAGLLH